MTRQQQNRDRDESILCQFRNGATIEEMIAITKLSRQRLKELCEHNRVKIQGIESIDETRARADEIALRVKNGESEAAMVLEYGISRRQVLHICQRRGVAGSWELKSERQESGFRDIVNGMMLKDAALKNRVTEASIRVTTNSPVP